MHDIPKVTFELIGLECEAPLDVAFVAVPVDDISGGEVDGKLSID